MLLVGAGAYIVAFYGALAMTVKRLHDRGRSGWFMLIVLIPLVGIWLVIEIGFLAGQPHANEYGDPVSSLSRISRAPVRANCPGRFVLSSATWVTPG